jgi:hypothetical protein
MNVTVEQALCQAHDKASLLRFAAEAAMTSAEASNEAIWSGLADVCDDIAVLTERVRKALDADALGIELASNDRRSGVCGRPK